MSNKETLYEKNPPWHLGTPKVARVEMDVHGGFFMRNPRETCMPMIGDALESKPDTFLGMKWPDRNNAKPSNVTSNTRELPCSLYTFSSFFKSRSCLWARRKFCVEEEGRALYGVSLRESSIAGSEMCLTRTLRLYTQVETTIDEVRQQHISFNLLEKARIHTPQTRHRHRASLYNFELRRRYAEESIMAVGVSVKSQRIV